MTKIRKWGEAHTFDDVGWFSGITAHSMILAPISAFATIYIIYLLINQKFSFKKRITLILLLISVVTTILMAASRTALIAAIMGVLIMLFTKFRSKIKKLLKAIIVLTIATIAVSPLFSTQFEKIIDKNKSTIVEAGKITTTRSFIWEQRISEFKRSPAFGIGFCTVEFIPDESVANENGTIEPGSSWLSVLSMTGLVGMISILLILIPTLIRLFKYSYYNENYPTLLIGLLSVMIIHMFAEGYIFSGGNPFCFFFWLLLGISYQLSKEAAAYSYEISNKKKNWPYVRR